jgi:hypothetical protein
MTCDRLVVSPGTPVSVTNKIDRKDIYRITTALNFEIDIIASLIGLNKIKTVTIYYR